MTWRYYVVVVGVSEQAAHYILLVHVYTPGYYIFVGEKGEIVVRSSSVLITTALECR